MEGIILEDELLFYNINRGTTIDLMKLKHVSKDVQYNYSKVVI
jgi:hypothetical protein